MQPAPSNQFLSRLGVDHQRIDHILNLIEVELLKFNDDEQDEDLPAIADALAYMEVYPDAVHHPAEEQLFELMAARSDPLVRQAIDKLRTQHKEITAATQTLKHDIDNILNDIVVPLDRVMSHLLTYLALQREHMTLENNAIFPVAERSLSDDDWHYLDTLLQQDPMFENTRDRFSTLYQRLLSDFEVDEA